MLFILGDVHGRYDNYQRLIRNQDFTLQLGDFGFDYSILGKIDPHAHRILAGNHDNYWDMNHPHFLGDFGLASHGDVEFFYIRGGRSIDRHRRIEGRSWWPEEELSQPLAQQAIQRYAETQPDVVVSHECPSSLLPNMPLRFNGITASYTSKLLEVCLDIHRPKFWFFAHHHLSFQMEIQNTMFKGLNELEGVFFDGEFLSPKPES